MEFSLNQHDVLPGILTMLLLIIAWFLRQKDAAQQREMTELKTNHQKDIETVREEQKTFHEEQKKSIDDLWKQHHSDTDALKDFKLEVAQKHYPMDVIDQKFEKIENTMSKGFESIMDNLNRLNAILLGRALGEKDDK